MITRAQKGRVPRHPGKGGIPHELTAAIAKGGADAERARSVLRHAIETAEGKPFDAAAIVGMHYATYRRLLEQAGMVEYEHTVRTAARRAARAALAAEKKTTDESLTFRDLAAMPRRAA